MFFDFFIYFIMLVTGPFLYYTKEVCRRTTLQLATRMAQAQLPRLQVPLPPIFLEHPGEPRVRWANWSAQLNNFFTLTNLTLPPSNQLNDRAKNAYLTTLLGSEGMHILSDSSNGRPRNVHEGSPPALRTSSQPSAC